MLKVLFRKSIISARLDCVAEEVSKVTLKDRLYATEMTPHLGL